jgi:CheY-like chemotaxis protein
MAEDDPDDRLLIKEAFRENHATDVILLDLNMPRKDGRETLEEIKTDPYLRHIPVVVLTTSNAEEDIMRSYNVGAAGYIIKPVKFSGLVEAIKGLMQYWEQVVRLPAKVT